jgi:uncharacterized membrane protein HdeD (DUF308 family)
MERKRDVRHADMELMHYRLGWLATIGLALMTVGMAALYAPYYSGFSLQNLIGSFFLISGGMLVVDAFWSRHEGRFVPEFLLGLLYLIFVLPIAVYAAGEARALTLFLSIFSVLEGILKIFLSLRLRRESNWTWGLTSGIVSAGGAARRTPGRRDGGDRSELQRAGHHNDCTRHAEDAGNA